jgi:hypothetical protein
MFLINELIGDVGLKIQGQKAKLLTPDHNHAKLLILFGCVQLWVLL